MVLAFFRQRLVPISLAGLAAVASASCGEVARTGRAPVQIVLDNIQAASGANPGEFGTVLYSDVLTLVEETVNGETVRIPTIFSDTGTARMRLILKNQSNLGSPTGPTEINSVTITRYRVRFLRSDGRNTPGVDVPYGFDGAVTATIADAGIDVPFEIVRHSMKREPPLRNLVNGGNATYIYTIAEVTFYGRDQAGNEVVATGMLSVNFGDWGDPD
jgi:hypothetical protein